MKIRFAVHRRPVSVNAMYMRSARPGAGRRGLILTPEARDYKAAVHAMAFAVAKQCGWPKPETVTQCAVTIVVFNTRHDVDACTKPTVDSLQGVFFANDRVVRPLVSDRDSDGGPPRVEITLEIPDAA